MSDEKQLDELRHENFMRGLKREDSNPDAYYSSYGGLDALLSQIGWNGNLIARAVAEHLALLYVRRTVAGLMADISERRTESPIEELFWQALLCYAANWTDEDVLFSRCTPTFGHSGSSPASSPCTLEVCLQHIIGEYRVDFLLTGHGLTTGPDPKGPLQIRPVSSVIVECDGHDFHERTKEQARRDKQRDRFLQSAGYPVFRFTGSEIFADPFRCAAEAFAAAFRTRP